MLFTNESHKSMSLISAAHRAKLIANGKANAFHPRQQINNIPPVCWIYDELSKATWLLTEIDRTNSDRAWGLIDAGDGKPDFEHVSLRELEDCHQTITLGDGSTITIGAQAMKDWHAKGLLSDYISAAAKAGRIVEIDHEALAA